MPEVSSWPLGQQSSKIDKPILLRAFLDDGSVFRSGLQPRVLLALAAFSENAAKMVRHLVSMLSERSAGQRVTVVGKEVSHYSAMTSDLAACRRRYRDGTGYCN